MQGLNELCIKLIVDGDQWGSLSAEKAVALLQPVMAVTPLHFVLVIPIFHIAHEEPWVAFPCKIRRANLAW